LEEEDFIPHKMAKLAHPSNPTTENIKWIDINELMASVVKKIDKNTTANLSLVSRRFSNVLHQTSLWKLMDYQFYDYNDKEISPILFLHLVKGKQIDLEMPALKLDLSSSNNEKKIKALQYITKLFDTENPSNSLCQEAKIELNSILLEDQNPQVQELACLIIQKMAAIEKPWSLVGFLFCSNIMRLLLKEDTTITTLEYICKAIGKQTPLLRRLDDDEQYRACARLLELTKSKSAVIQANSWKGLSNYYICDEGMTSRIDYHTLIPALRESLASSNDKVRKEAVAMLYCSMTEDEDKSVVNLFYDCCSTLTADPSFGVKKEFVKLLEQRSSFCDAERFICKGPLDSCLILLAELHPKLCEKYSRLIECITRVIWDLFYRAGADTILQIKQKFNISNTISILEQLSAIGERCRSEAQGILRKINA
jgi:hypothetical protein